jgi:hypothetical protein
LGLTTVTCTAADDAGNTSSATFAITVEDTTAPTLGAVPADLTIEATGPAGATAAFSSPTALDAVDLTPSLTCDALSGSIFPLGLTTVTCTAADDAGNTSSATFSVTVRDTTPPVLVGIPADQTVQATTPAGAAVTFLLPTATDSVDVVTSVSCAPPSGSNFPLGVTAVSCTAIDDSGNADSATFQITVVAGPTGGTRCETGFSGDDRVGEGNVKAKLSKRRLLIKGDGAANNIVIESGSQPGSLRITGRGDTTVNRRSHPVEFRKFDHVDIRMAGGDDVVAIIDALLDSGVQVRMDDDNDQLILCGLDVSGPVRTGAGRGSDLLAVDDSIFRGLVVFGAGNEADEIRLERRGDATSPPTEFRDSLTIFTEDGDDTIQIGDQNNPGRRVNVTRCTEIDGGIGFDEVLADFTHNNLACGPNLRGVERHRRG